MNDTHRRERLRSRVYYVAGVMAVVAIVAVAVARVAPVRAQGPGVVVDLSVEPAMTKGPADAVVTIVEFSDYQ